jgi:hypothetical protein
LQRNQAVQSRELEILARFVEALIRERVDIKVEHAALHIHSVVRTPKPGEDEKP